MAHPNGEGPGRSEQTCWNSVPLISVTWEATSAALAATLPDLPPETTGTSHNSGVGEGSRVSGSLSDIKPTGEVQESEWVLGHRIPCGPDAAHRGWGRGRVRLCWGGSPALCFCAGQGRPLPSQPAEALEIYVLKYKVFFQLSLSPFSSSCIESLLCARHWRFIE